MSADVVGYSRLMAADEAGTFAQLKAHRRELIEPKTAEHHGRVVKLMGDGTLMEFGSVVDAINFAVEVQQAMVERNDGIPEDRKIRYRVGINLGEIIVDGEDIYGDGVNIAARLEGLAEPGGIFISGKVYEEVRNKLPTAFEDLGEQEVKNIPEPVRVYRWTDAAVDPMPNSAEAEEALALPDKPSIAVLPFDNMSGDAEQEYFVDGITEDIITALSKFHSFLVIARNSTFTYKGQAVNVRTIAEELSVRYVVEGSVRKAGNRVRVTAQLIEAASGNHIWAERYDRDLEDIFDLQDEITQTIVSAIEQEIGSVERIRAVRKRPGSLAAWELLQRGLHHVYQMDRGGLQTGADLLRQCIAKDPSFAQAHSLLAFAIIHQVFLGTIDEFDQALAEATMHTNAAIKYDARDSLAHEMLARILSIQHRYDEAVAEAVRAVQFNPNSVSAHFALATIYYFANRSAEALEPIDSAMRLSPKDPRHFTHLHVKGAILGEVGRLQEGLKLLRQAVSMPHGDYRSALLLARYAAEAGLVEEAKRAAGRVLELKPDFTLNLFEKKLHANFHPDLMRPFLSHLIDVGLPK